MVWPTTEEEARAGLPSVRLVASLLVFSSLLASAGTALSADSLMYCRRLLLPTSITTTLLPTLLPVVDTVRVRLDTLT